MERRHNRLCLVQHGDHGVVSGRALLALIWRGRKQPYDCHRKIWLGWEDSKPPHGGIKIRCLTTWLHPISARFYFETARR